MKIILIACGGALGSVLRYLFTCLEKTLFNGQGAFPLATFSVNILGSLAIGIAVAKVTQNQTLESTYLYAILVIGFLGGFTTFSSFTAENLRLLVEQKFLASLIYTSLSFTLSLATCYFSYWIFSRN